MFWMNAGWRQLGYNDGYLKIEPRYPKNKYYMMGWKRGNHISLFRG